MIIIQLYNGQEAESSILENSVANNLSQMFQKTTCLGYYRQDKIWWILIKNHPSTIST